MQPVQDPAVVLVDDDPDHRELVALALEHCCAADRVLAFDDGSQALDWLMGRGAHAGRDTRQQPRLVLLDLKMNRVDGLEMLRALRTHPATAHLPVVVHSSSLESEDVARSLAAGATDYIRKAVGFGELRAGMQQLCERWLHANAMPG